MGYVNTKKKTDKITYETESSFALGDISATEPKIDLELMTLHESTKEKLRKFIAFCDEERREAYLRENEITFIRSGGVAASFHGQSGTGKTTVAEGCAKALGKRFIQVTHDDLSSPYPGKTSENYKLLFKTAKDLNALLLIDEAETAIGERFSNPSQAADAGLNSTRTTLLSLLNEFEGVVIFATNHPCRFDKAMFRRIQFHLQFGTPSKEMLHEIWRYHINEGVPKEFSYEYAVELTDGLNGGHIAMIATNLVAEALVGNKLTEKLLKKTVTDIKEEMLTSNAMYLDSVLENSTDLEGK